MKSVYDAARGYQIAFSYRDVPAEVDALIKLAGLAPQTVLELAAGPAEHAVEFARRGADATALDLSEAMLTRAGENAAAIGVTIHALRADMRDFTLPYQVDLAFCMISSISHLLTLDDLIAHFRCVRGCLRPGGAYVVEASHPTEEFGAKATVTEWETTVGAETVRLVWGAESDVMDPVTQVTPVSVTMTIAGADGLTESIETVEDNRFWTRDEMDAAARLAGLRLDAQHGDFDGKALDAEGAWRMIMVFRGQA